MNLKNKVTEEDLINLWDNWSKKRKGYPAYDKWLDKYDEELKKRNSEILDLGCGIGANTAYLLERGYTVLSCDISREALKNIEENIPNSKVLYLDMTKKISIPNNSYAIVLADLCLQYFCEEDTFHIVSEIKRILKPDGILLARVARTDDYDYGAGIGEMMEKNYYFEGNYYKRFFDDNDIERFFKDFGKLEYEKTSLIRDEETYQKPKQVYEIKVIKK